MLLKKKKHLSIYLRVVSIEWHTCEIDSLLVHSLFAVLIGLTYKLFLADDGMVKVWGWPPHEVLLV